jgi:hypothetical protein
MCPRQKSRRELRISISDQPSPLWKGMSASAFASHEANLASRLSLGRPLHKSVVEKGNDSWNPKTKSTPPWLERNCERTQPTPRKGHLKQRTSRRSSGSTTGIRKEAGPRNTSNRTIGPRKIFKGVLREAGGLREIGHQTWIIHFQRRQRHLLSVAYNRTMALGY